MVIYTKEFDIQKTNAHIRLRKGKQKKKDKVGFTKEKQRNNKLRKKNCSVFTEDLLLPVLGFIVFVSMLQFGDGILKHWGEYN